MGTNLTLDDDLIIQAMSLGKHRTKRETVNEALQTYVASLQQEWILDIFDQMDFDPDYDYKAERSCASAQSGRLDDRCGLPTLRRGPRLRALPRTGLTCARP